MRYGETICRVTARAPQMSLQQLRWGRRNSAPQTRATQRKAEVEQAAIEGRDLLAEIAAQVQEQIEQEKARVAAVQNPSHGTKSKNETDVDITPTRPSFWKRWLSS